jgi:hypothetical protein
MVKRPEAPVYVNERHGSALQIRFITRKSASDTFNIPGAWPPLRHPTR